MSISSAAPATAANSAREHASSSYTPICLACGLILCSINQPHHACPHCSSTLLTPAARASLEQRLDKLVSETLTREADERQRALEDAHAASTAFPSLPAPSPLPSGQPRASNQAHKVLSLNAKTKKATLSSYKPVLPPPPQSHTPQVDEEFRVPPPPAEVSYTGSRPNPNRPWARVGDDVFYVPVPRKGKGKDGTGAQGKAEG
jgi:hypothetical protein